MSTTPEFPQSDSNNTNPTQVLPSAVPGTDPADTSAAWGTPSTRSSKGWTLKRGLAAAGIAVLVAGGGGAAVYAATAASNSSQAQGGPGGQGMGGGPGGQGMGGQGMGGAMSAGLGNSIRGEYVVEQNGSYLTKLSQTGEVTAVSSTSITVKSADGVSQSYQVSDSTTVGTLSSAQQGGPPAAAQGSANQSGSAQNSGNSGNSGTSSGSIADIATGDSVRIIALKESSGNSAESISKVSN
ncbi:hypothetical protein [Psychromicrobium lacuslunae]|uniref:hypothetical protein n=1 Tax=Psychromicrobium lacuslunae TaxID=1618207 RepID=UPI00069641FF|nr:hypothetical protein [Psychromicrobium lacuslunae]